MRVATFNIHDCVGRDRRFDPQRIVELLVEIDADLVALQEVTLDGAGVLRARFERETSLGAIDGTLFERGVGRYGNLVLLRDATVVARLHDLSFPGRERRGCVELVLDLDGLPLTVYAVHLGLRRGERAAQIDRLATLVSQRPGAAVLLGDLNVWGGRAALRPLAAAGFRHLAVRSFPTWPMPLFPLDRILAREPATILHCWRHDTPRARRASDHFAVVAELRLAR